MYLLENPVLQRELLVNLRMARAFLVLFAYVAVVSGVVFLAWPADQEIILGDTSKARRLFDLFVIGQFVLVALMAPAFAAGSISGEKERKTYEMLLASPLRPAAILTGKLLSALCYLTLLIFSTLPIVMICLPLGGVNFFELLAAYVLLVISAATFGIICLACSTYFQRTASALVVSYLISLPIALLGVLLWLGLADQAAGLRLFLSLGFAPAGAVFIAIVLISMMSSRLLYPPDLGSEAKEVVNEEEEMQKAVGMVIQRDRFPDNLFAPSRRNTLLADGANPVFDKEMRSEIFSGGTLMARLVIQVSMFLAIPLMAAFLFFQPKLAPLYVAYVVIFNMLVGPVFMAGSITSERERETLDLLLTTNLSPAQILWPKWLAGLRVSTVLTSFLVPPLALAGLMISEFWPNWPTLLGYLAIILMTCLTTATLALFCSVVFRRTAVSMLVSYVALIVLFVVPVAVYYFSETFYSQAADQYILPPELAQQLSLSSPFMAAASLPLIFPDDLPGASGWQPIYLGYFQFSLALNAVLLMGMLWLFQRRWRVAQ